MTSRGWTAVLEFEGRARILAYVSHKTDRPENSSRYITMDHQNLIPALGKQQAQARHLSNFTANAGEDLFRISLCRAPDVIIIHLKCLCAHSCMIVRTNLHAAGRTDHGNLACVPWE